MPRNKGYAPMKPRTTTESPIGGNSVQYSPKTMTSSFDESGGGVMVTSLTKKRNGRPPAPPPRYTSPPTIQQRCSTPTDQEMPLVSNASSSSLPIYVDLRPQRHRESDSTPSPEPPQCTGRRRKMRNRREADIMESAWTGKQNPQQQQQLHHQLTQQQEWDIHEKRKIMMGKMKQYKTEGRAVIQSFDSNQTVSSSTCSVPADLLEKRRVLMKTLHKVQSVAGTCSGPGSTASLNTTVSNQWGSNPSAMDGRGRLTSQSSTDSITQLMGGINVTPRRRELPETPTRPSSIQQFLFDGGGKAGIVRQQSLVVVGNNNSNSMGTDRVTRKSQLSFMRSQSLEQGNMPSSPPVLKGANGMMFKHGLSVIHSTSADSNESVVWWQRYLSTTLWCFKVHYCYIYHGFLSHSHLNWSPVHS